MNQLQPTPKGFFKALFDFSFTSYVTPKIIKIIFGLVVIVAAVIALVIIIAGFEVNIAAGIFALIILAPLAFLFYVIIYRVLLEVVMAVFTIAENTTRMVAPAGSITVGPAPPTGYSASPPAASSQPPEPPFPSPPPTSF